MKVIRMRNGSVYFLDADVPIERILGSSKRFFKLGDRILNRADVTEVVSKEEYDVAVKQSAGMVLTSQGWMSRTEYAKNSFLKILVPEEMLIKSQDVQLSDGKDKMLEGKRENE